MKSILETRADLATGKVTSLELVESALENAQQHIDKNIFAHLAADQARAAAKAADAQPHSGALHGIPITIKDLFNVAQMPTKGGTRAELPNEFHNPQIHAQAVQNLIEAGAIILGKVNMHEIALGITGENLATGDVKNPLDSTRQAGGSSSGSAAAVALGIGFASLGSDTGGSVRIPASFCGIVGYKPTFGWIPLEGALNLSTTCDHAGVLSNSVTDAHTMLEVLAHRNLSLRHLNSLAGVRLGVPRTWLEGRLGISVRQDFETQLEQFRLAGATVIDVEPAHLDLASQCYTPIVRAEAAFVHRLALKNQPQSFNVNILPALEDGTQLSVSTYLQARAERRLVRAGLEATLHQIDALVLPTAPLSAQIRGTEEVLLESGTRKHRDAFIELTLPFSLVGLPALSIPFTKESGLPVGLQIVAARGDDSTALELGWWLERQG